MFRYCSVFTVLYLNLQCFLHFVLLNLLTHVILYTAYTLLHYYITTVTAFCYSITSACNGQTIKLTCTYLLTYRRQLHVHEGGNISIMTSSDDVAVPVWWHCDTVNGSTSTAYDRLTSSKIIIDLWSLFGQVVNVSDVAVDVDPFTVSHISHYLSELWRHLSRLLNDLDFL